MGLFLRTPQDPPTPPLAASGHRNRARAAAYNAPRAITASAERIVLGGLMNMNRPYAEWQREAWVGYERVGEIHFGFNLLANLLSRVRIYPAAVGEANEAPVDVRQKAGSARISKDLADAAELAMDDLQRTDFASMIRAFSLNLSVPGECYLVGPCPQTLNLWSIRSVDEVLVRADGAYLVPTRNGGAGSQMLPKDVYIARMWRQHPRYSREPDSSMVGVADSIEELLMLQRLVRSATRTRLNAGMLFVPDGISGGLSASTEEPLLEEPNDPLSALANASTVDPSGPFLAQLMQSMVTPISNEGSASAVVPMVVTGPGDLGAQIRHVTFERASDQWLVDRTDNIMNRILQGIDMPKEIVTGLQHVRYSNAVVIDEGMYKANLEPLALVFVDALTDVYLRPTLQAKGFSDDELGNIVVWYDPSEIVTRPNKEDEATQGTDRFLLSPTAWRREHGYAETDAPTEDDLAAMLLNKVSALPPDALTKLLQKALPQILGDLELPSEVAQQAQDAQQQAQQAQQPGDPGNGPNVVQFPQPDTAQPAADPQRAAIKQVGVK